MDRPLEYEDAQATDRSEKILARMEAIASSEKYRHLQARSLRARHAGPAVVLEAEDRKMDAVILSVPFKRRFGSCGMGATASYVFDNASCRVILWREPTPVLAEF
jgi:nucleotide-binding universal stress UspA family protein